MCNLTAKVIGRVGSSAQSLARKAVQALDRAHKHYCTSPVIYLFTSALFPRTPLICIVNALGLATQRDGSRIKSAQHCLVSWKKLKHKQLYLYHLRISCRSSCVNPIWTLSAIGVDAAKDWSFVQKPLETAKLISAFVFATRIVQFLFYLYPKFQASALFCGSTA